MFASLFISRPLLNAAAVIAHYRKQGVAETLLPDDMHVTVCYSKQTLNWARLQPDERPILVPAGGWREMERFDKGALVLRFFNEDLLNRHDECRTAGASSDYPEYKPHVTITYGSEHLSTAKIQCWTGPLEFGAERFRQIDSTWTPTEKNMRLTTEQLAKAVCVSVPTIIKSRVEKASGRRIVEVEASSQEVDSEGDVILQSALLNSAQEFVATGCLDIDHISELGYQMGVPDPASFIVGRPLEVKDIGGGRTSVVGELRRSLDGSYDPKRYKYDELWESLQTTPQVPWYASIFGFPHPGMMDDCEAKGVCEYGARRFLIRGINWRSLAFTRKPVNQSLRGRARIITAKAAMSEIAKSMGLAPASAAPPFVAPRLQEMWASRKCMKCGVDKMPTLGGYQDHYAKCCGYPEDAAELCAYAMMHKTNLERVFSS